MKTLSSIKKDIDFNKSLASLIEVLKSIAVAQYRVLEQRLVTFEKLLTTIENFFESINISEVEHPFIMPSNNSLAVVAVTSDSGLLGGLNMQVIGTALAELKNTPGKLIVIGERGKMYAQGSGVPIVAFGGIKDEERYGQAMQLRDYLVSRILSNSFGAVKVVYPRPVTFTVQRVEMATFLPFPLASPKVGSGTISDTIYESTPGDIIEYIVGIWMGQKLYDIFGLSRLAEFAARYVHLEGSHQRLKELDAKTKLEYFRVRHELIDRNMRELFAARLLYAG